ncbi:AraC family transcriptional regulator [Roseiconus lacunae]|uniref:AraC family transcriptional regulator n=1 Tax=Roseiconus lacunae TaxID=2605694 RepID=A0ABT7PFA8_9BACT|nr:AraC family transcriptional regulator [Roseiconus lacunae]MDM4015177.1 AraC family transcriptional regulator [Roseiconus lacunae]WRQ50140.1 AraC family transcriptional regulator [Stieleria sp. HD01]
MSLEGAIITEVTLVDKIERSRTGEFRSQSLPDHLLHVCISGEVDQVAAGVAQRFGAGQAIWYHENEPIRGRVIVAPWIFYTVNFRAPALPPPPLTRRVSRVTNETIDRMRRLHEAWLTTNLSPVRRHLQVHSVLCDVISDLLAEEEQHHRIDRPTQLWWEIESRLRSRLDEPIDLKLLGELSGTSQRSVARACHLATGMSPMKRVKQMRLNYARGLTQLSKMSMTHIALQIGYSRVQEFSRDYRAAFGCTPSQDRSAGPDY